jgi:hypothetical protein
MLKILDCNAALCHSVPENMYDMDETGFMLGILSQGAKWYVITYHLIVSARNYEYGGDISDSWVHTIKFQEYIPILVCR